MTLKDAIIELKQLAGDASCSIDMEFWHRPHGGDEIEWRICITAERYADWQHYAGATLDDAMAQARAALRPVDPAAAVEAASAAMA